MTELCPETTNNGYYVALIMKSSLVWNPNSSKF